MKFVPQMPAKAQFLSSFSFTFVNKLCAKSTTEFFVGGRPGYQKDMLFAWLLVKKLTNWDYRTIGSMAGVSASTLVRANTYFLKRGIYQKVFVHFRRKATKQGLVPGKYVAMDSSFVHTFSKRGELGSEGWNEYKKGYGFKLHLAIDAETRFPIACKLTNGIAADCTLAIPLLKEARSIMHKTKYVLADKGYDWGDLVNWINKTFHAKAAIPIKRVTRGKNYSWEAATRNFWEKAKGRSIKKSIYNRRVSVEQVFGLLKRVYHLGKEETRGIENFFKNCYLTLICYMLKLFYIMKIG